jgi:hypothetical protein
MGKQLAGNVLNPGRNFMGIDQQHLRRIYKICSSAKL